MQLIIRIVDRFIVHKKRAGQEEGLAPALISPIAGASPSSRLVLFLDTCSISGVLVS